MSQSRKKILVIDDDPSMQALMKRQLENAGYAVLLAEDGIVGGRLAPLLTSLLAMWTCRI